MKEHLSETHEKIDHCMIISTWLSTPRKVIMKANIGYQLTQKNGKVV
jgi:hypothetical protein